MISAAALGKVSPVTMINFPNSNVHRVESKAGRQADTIELSERAQLLAAEGPQPSARAERIAQIQAQIAAGTYETQQKIDVAIDRLADELYRGR